MFSSITRKGGKNQLIICQNGKKMDQSRGSISFPAHEYAAFISAGLRIRVQIDRILDSRNQPRIQP